MHKTKLQVLREEAGMSQTALSYKTQISATHISKLEHRQEKLWIGWAEKLAVALGYKGDPNDLLEEIE